MSSGSRGGRVSDRSGNTKPATADHNSQHNNNAITDKNLKAPTADQIRLAQITENSQDNVFHENIEQFMQITRKSREDASIILHDYGYDLEAAVNATLEGNTNLDAWHERTKKKKTKSKVEVENKENRRGGGGNASDNTSNKERSASRGRGGGTASTRGGASGRGRRDAGEGGRGGGPGRRGGRMANGGGPLGGGRGRGGRSIRGGRGGASGRGSSPHFGSDSNTFHTNRQNNNHPNSGGFVDPIDTWGEIPTGKLDSGLGVGDLGTTDASPLEEWGEEWTGSLDKTNVFTHSSVEPTPPPASDLTAIDAAKLVNSSSLMQSSPYQDDGHQQQTVGLLNNTGSGPGDAPQSYSAAANQSVVPPSLTGLVGSQAQQPVASLSSSSIGGFAALLQQAAPQSLLSTSGANNSAVTNGSVSHLQQHATPSILGGISTNVGDVIKASGSTTTLGGSSMQQQPGGMSSYSANNNVVAASISSNNYSSSQPHSSIFSTSLQNSVSRSLGSSLSSSSGMNNSSVSSSNISKPPGVILPSHHQGVTLPPSATGHHQPSARVKQNKVKPQQTSKIPLTAVEMPDDVMSAINMQMTGLQFGSEGFDFLSDSNKAPGMANETNSSYSANANAYSNPPPPSGYPSSLVNASGSATSSYGVSNNSMPTVTTPSAAAASTYPSYHNSNAAGYPSANSNSVSSYQSSTYSNNSLSSTVAGLAADRAEVQKSLSSVKQNTLSQASKLGPEPIPYPPNQLQQSANSSTVPGNNVSGTVQSASNSGTDLTKNSQQQQAASSNDASAAASAGSYMNMRQSAAATTPQKKDLGSSSASNTAGNLPSASNPLGSLVGNASVSSHYSSYSLPKTSSNFPSPPSGPYSQQPVQNSYSSNAGDNGYNSNNSSTNNVGGNNNSAPAITSTSVSSASSNSNSNNNVTSYGSSSSSYGNSQSVAPQSNASVQYQNNGYSSSSSHSALGMNAAASAAAKQLTPLKETSQVNYSGSDGTNNSVPSNSSTTNASNNTTTNNTSNSSAAASSSLSNLQQAAAAVHQQMPQQKTSVANVPPPGAGSKSLSGVGMPPGVQQPQHQPSHITQQHQVTAVAQQQLLVQQPQQQQQYVNSNALQNTMPYFQLPQQIYPFDEMQLLQQQQRLAHMPQQGVPSTLPGSRDASSLTAAAAAYSASADSKYRTDQNSSPVPSAINTQTGHAGAYIANAGNAAGAMPHMYMYPQNMAVPSSAFAQYGHQAIIQLPPSTAGSTSSQFQHAKLQYNAPPAAAAAGPTYYDSQGGGDYKGGYGSGSQGQNKQGVGSNTGSMTNSVTDMPAYKNHLTKSYDKPAAFHTSTPPPFNLANSGGPQYPPHAQVFLPTMPHQSTLMHHQLHQDGTGSGGQRGSSSSVQSKNTAKPFQPFWAN